MQQPCISTNHASWCNHHKANMRWDPERLGSNQHLGAGGATVLCALLLHVPIASSLCVFAHCVTTGTSCFENTVTNFLSSVTLDKYDLVNCILITVSLSNALYRTLGKEKSLLWRQVMVTEALPSLLTDTWQIRSICRVFAGLALGKESSSELHVSLCAESHWLALGEGNTSGPFASLCVECSGGHSAKGAYLPSVRTKSLDKEVLLVPMCVFVTS